MGFGATLEGNHFRCIGLEGIIFAHGQGGCSGSPVGFIPLTLGTVLNGSVINAWFDRDHGWIHTLLEEAENERMHLLTFLKLKQPGPVFRFGVMVSQGVMFNAFFLAYLVSPKACHRFVGYIEEEAVHTYTAVSGSFRGSSAWLLRTKPPIRIPRQASRLCEWNVGIRRAGVVEGRGGWMQGGTVVAEAISESRSVVIVVRRATSAILSLEVSHLLPGEKISLTRPSEERKATNGGRLILLLRGREGFLW